MDWVPACEPKGHCLSSPWGHMPGLWDRSPARGAWKAATHWCFSPSLAPSLPLCLKINKISKTKKQCLNLVFQADHLYWVSLFMSPLLPHWAQGLCLRAGFLTFKKFVWRHHLPHYQKFNVLILNSVLSSAAATHFLSENRHAFLQWQRIIK